MKKIIKNFVIFKLLEGLALSFFFSTYSLFLQEKGLDSLEMGILNCICMVSIFILEIPTGAIADFFGRKCSTVIGLFMYSCSFLIYFFSNGFWCFALAEIIGALAMACVSGALEALVVDSLKYHGYTDNLEKVFRRGELRAIGVVIGSVSGGFIGGIDLSYPWLASAIAFFVLAIWAIFSLKEEYFIKPDKVTINFSALRKIISESLSYGFKNNKLMSIILFLGFTSFVFQPLNMYWPLILKDNFSFPENNMGIIFALITAFSYAGVQFSKFFQKKFKELKIAIILSQVITFIGIFGSCFFFKLPLFLSFFLLHEFGRGIREPLARAYLNDCINNKNRATVLSLQSMVVHLGSGFGLIISGIIAKNSGELNSWLVSAIILFFIIIIFWWKKN